MSRRWRRAPARLVRQWPTVVWLTVVWVLLWGNVAPGTVLAGLGVACLVVLAARMPSVSFHGRVRPWGLARLVARLAADIVRASTQVALLALTPRRVPHGAVVRVQLRTRSDLYLTLTAQLTSLVPGSLVVEAHRLSGVLYVHVLDVGPQGAEAARRSVLDQEERVLRALASPAELVRTGLARTGPASGGSGRADREGSR